MNNLIGKDLILNASQFKPEDHLYPLIDTETGEVKVNKFTHKTMYKLPNNAKITWFWLKCPEGRIDVERTASQMYIEFKASIYKDASCENPTAVGYSRVSIEDSEYDTFLYSNCQLWAIGQALNFAGFGCELELFLNKEEFHKEPSPDKKVDKVEEQKEELKKIAKKAIDKNNSNSKKISSLKEVDKIQDNNDISTELKEIEKLKETNEDKNIVNDVDLKEDVPNEYPSDESNNCIPIVKDSESTSDTNGIEEQLNKKQEEIVPLKDKNEDTSEKELENEELTEKSTEDIIIKDPSNVTFSTKVNHPLLSKYVGSKICSLCEEQREFMSKIITIKDFENIVSEETISAIRDYLN